MSLNGLIGLEWRQCAWLGKGEVEAKGGGGVVSVREELCECVVAQVCWWEGTIQGGAMHVPSHVGVEGNPK